MLLLLLISINDDGNLKNNITATSISNKSHGSQLMILSNETDLVFIYYFINYTTTDLDYINNKKRGEK